MGGLNSGRSRSSKPKLGQLLCIKLKDISQYFGNVPLHTEARGTMTWSNGNQANVTYNQEGLRISFAANGQTYAQQINATYTPCTYGGKGRLWMQCACGGRTNKLYFHRLRFVCRKCTGLAYSSQSLSAPDRGTNAVWRVQKKLDPAGGYEIDEIPDRPKGMHQSTYERITGKLEEAMEKREAAWDERLMRVIQTLTGIEDLIGGTQPAPKSRKPGFWG